MKLKTLDIANGKDYLSHAVLGSATDAAMASIDQDSGLVDIRMTFNGIEIPIERFFKNLEEQHDRIVGEEAHRLITTQLGGKVNLIVDKLLDIDKVVSTELKGKILDIFPDANFYWDDDR